MSDIQLSLDDIRGLAKLERQMDDGEIPFVVFDGYRWSMPEEAMSHFQLRSGQTVSFVILREIQSFLIANIRRRIEIAEAKHDN